ncbi:uncharacterized protein EV154DRAFT_580515, partial [Mucor mucedo]|uniref:uncharacterized protein n=1 Tax=Mucor mucedo TaxID=29922 RepID=UPI00222115A2
MPHTFIILDGHPNAFIPTLRIDNSVPPTHRLPPLPLWACMVQGSIEFCRVAWDIEQSKQNLINVIVAGSSPVILNDSTQQNIQTLQQQFPPVQPRHAYPQDRLQPAIEIALSKYLEKIEIDVLQRCRIVLVTIAKQPNEKSFDHVQVDVLRLLPYSASNDHTIPPKITNKQISSQITMSVYSIPNGQEDLKFAMRNLSQLYYNINVLHISNIPMKSSGNAQSCTVTLYYQANGKHLINQQEPLRNSFIHDPKYLKYRELKLIYSKRSKRALPATEVYLGMTFKGSISYLVTPETPSSYTHILMAQNGGIFLHCLNSQLQAQFAESENASIGLVGTSIVYEPKTKEMMDTLISPILFENVNEFLSATDPLCKTVSLNPFRFSHHLPIMTLNEKGLCTSRWIEKATRWRTCFHRNSETVVKQEMEEVGVKHEEDTGIDAAWGQVNRYENMSLREKEDAALGYLPDFKQEDHKAFSGQLPPKANFAAANPNATRINPNFKSRRGTLPSNPLPVNNNRQYNRFNQPPQQAQKYPDPSLAVPYLTYVAPTLEEKAQEEKAEEEDLGEPGNLLWLYWMNDKVKKRGNGEEGDLSSGTELVYKNGQWKRIKKEFLGRTAQAGEKGE